MVPCGGQHPPAREHQCGVCVELLEAQVERKKRKWRKIKGASAHHLRIAGASFQEGREDIAPG